MTRADAGATAPQMLGGSASPLFSELQGAFQGLLQGPDAAGAAVAAVVGGEVVTHLWGGEVGGGEQWTRETLCPVFSVTKALSALVVLSMFDSGALDPDEPLVGEGPSRRDVPTVAQALGHTAGRPALAAPTTVEEALDPVAMGERLLAQPPEWGLGEAHGYHALTFGWLLDAAVRSRTGRSLGALLRDLAQGSDVWIGTPEAEHNRIARMTTPPADAQPPGSGPTDLSETDAQELRSAMASESSLSRRALMNPPLLRKPWLVNRPDVLESEWAAVNGTATALALAELAGAVAGGSLISPSTLSLASQPVSEGIDLVLLQQSRFGLGFMLPGPLFDVPSPTAVGHTGASGSILVIDPAHQLGFAYLTRTTGVSLGPDPRPRSLVAALYRDLASLEVAG